jgi:peptidoglycan/LPS O-acetylase OafA/YrhL
MASHSELVVGSLAALIFILLGLRGTDIFIALIAPFFILGLTNERSLTSRLLGRRIAHHLGLLSYSVYLIHCLLYPW